MTGLVFYSMLFSMGCVNEPSKIMYTNSKLSEQSHVTIIDNIRKSRNDLIKDFLDERYLKEYVADKYKASELSKIKIESIKQDLKGLLISPVDVEHYELLVTKMKDHDTSSWEDNDELYYHEIENILKKYIY